MSQLVTLDNLRREAARFGSTPFLLTVADDGRPHSVAAAMTWRGDELVLACGKRTRGNATARPLVSLLWAPVEAGDYSLIVDGEARVEDPGREEDDAVVIVRPTKAVMHRPGKGPVPAGAGCADDCVPLLRTLPGGGS